MMMMMYRGISLLVPYILTPGGGRGGYSWDFSVGLCRPAGSPNPDPISHQKCQFSQPFSDLATKIHIHSQIIPLRN